MAAGSTPTRATPYAVVVRYTGADRRPSDHRQSVHKRLADALARVTATSLAWQRLIGGQFSPLRWVVIDTRDFSEWHEGPHPLGDTKNEYVTQGRRYHHRDRGAELAGRRTAGQHPGRSIFDRYRL